MSIKLKKHDTEACIKNLNILGHAQLIELDIGSRCGGHGVCGGDRVQIPENMRRFFSDVTDDEKNHLTEAQLKAGWRLACQCYPNTDELDLNIEY